jgi:hypothetical protein
MRVVESGGASTKLAWAGPIRRLPRALALATPALALVVGGLLLKQRLDARAVAVTARDVLVASPSPSPSAQPERELGSTSDESTRAAIAQQLMEAKARADEVQARSLAAKASGGDAGAAPRGSAGAGAVRASGARRRLAACGCTPGDPLCSCL